MMVRVANSACLLAASGCVSHFLGRMAMYAMQTHISTLWSAAANWCQPHNSLHVYPLPSTCSSVQHHAAAGAGEPRVADLCGHQGKPCRCTGAPVLHWVWHAWGLRLQRLRSTSDVSTLQNLCAHALQPNSPPTHPPHLPVKLPATAPPNPYPFPPFHPELRVL